MKKETKMVIFFGILGGILIANWMERSNEPIQEPYPGQENFY